MTPTQPANAPEGSVCARCGGLVFDPVCPPASVPLTPEKYTALAHRIASNYAHRSDPKHIAYTFLPHTLEQFVRAIEAEHGIRGEAP